MDARLLCYLVVLAAKVAEGIVSRCESAPVNIGALASIVCIFDSDVRKLQRNIYLDFTKSSGSFVENIMSCKWQAEQFICKIRDGFKIVGNITNQIAIEIQEMKQMYAGQYWCEVLASREQPYRCVLTIKDITTPSSFSAFSSSAETPCNAPTEGRLSFQPPLSKVGVEVGRHFLHVCRANCNCTLSWKRISAKSNVTVATDGVLSISDIQRDKHGTYLCVASNNCGSAHITLKIVVQYAPVLVSGQEFTRISAEENESINLTCSFDSNPAPQLEWLSFQDVKPVDIPVQWNSTVTTVAQDDGIQHFIYKSSVIFNVQCAPNSTISCTAKNTLGHKIKYYYLDVNCSYDQRENIIILASTVMVVSTVTAIIFITVVIFILLYFWRKGRLLYDHPKRRRQQEIPLYQVLNVGGGDNMKLANDENNPYAEIIYTYEDINNKENSDILPGNHSTQNPESLSSTTCNKKSQKSENMIPEINRCNPNSTRALIHNSTQSDYLHPI